MTSLPALPAEVQTERLRLPVITADEVAAVAAGRRGPQWHADYPRQDDLDAMSMVRADGEGATWGPRHVVRRFDDLHCGSIGFFGAPSLADDGVLETEIGYGLVADARGHGAATEAVRALVAEAERAGVRIRASVEPDNRASLRVLAKCGFTELRGSNEDGHLVMARPLPR